MAMCGARFGSSRFGVLCWLSRCLLGTACNDVWTVLSVQCRVQAAAVRTVVTTIQAVLYWVFSAQCTGCWGFFMVVDTGQDHWVEGITLSTGILMTIFCQRAVSTFTPHTASSLFPPPSISQPLPLSPVLSPETNYPPPPPSLPPHTVMHYILTHNQTQPHNTHTLWRSVPLSSPHLSWSLFHSLAQPVVFFNGGFCPFHLLENKGFLCTQDRGKEKDGEPVSEEEVLPSSVVEWAGKKSHFTREETHFYWCQPVLFWLY